MITRVLLSLLLLPLLVSASPAQNPEGCLPGAIWVAADKGLSGMPVPGEIWNPSSSAVVQDGRLFLLHTAGPATTDRYVISTWDGDGWHDSLMLSVNGSPVEGIASIGGALHLYGGFTGINGDTAHGLARWNGSSWEDGGLPAGGVVLGVTEFRGEPYTIVMTGQLPDIGYYRNITIVMRRHAGVWSEMADFRSTDVMDTGAHVPNPGLIDVMVPGRDGLYIGGWFDSVGGKPLANITVWDGSTFGPVGDGSTIEVNSMRMLGDELYAGGEFTGTGIAMAHWDGSRWLMLTKYPDYFGIFGSHRGQLYSMRVAGAGPPDFYSVVRWNRDSSETISGLAGRPYGFIEYGGDLYAYGEIVSSCGIPINGVARLCDGACGTAAGIIYRDDDGDCIGEAAEPRLPGFLVEMAPGDHISITNADGIFREPLPPGTYTVRPIPPRYWSFCATSRRATMTAPDSRITGIEFGAKIVETKQDVAISLACGTARDGAPLHYSIRYSGIGASPSSGTVRLTLDDPVVFTSGTPAPTRVNGKVIEWDFQDLAMFESRDIHVVAEITSPGSGTASICASADISITTENDAFDHDNHDTVCATVNDPHGANTITAAPGYDDDRIYYLAPADTMIAYTVRFSNTGADTVHTVTVTDVLGELHDMSTIVFGAASHPYTAAFIGPGALRIIFKDIDLPPATSGDGAEQGYVKYALRVKKSLAPGTLIPNAAGIGFDYNRSAATNIVTSRLLLHQSGVPSSDGPAPITIAPNPARERALIGLGRDGGTVELHTLLGERARSWRITAASADLDLSGLAPGLYLLRVTTARGVTEEPLMIVR